MVSLGTTINVGDLPESTNFDPIPAGTYQAMISNVEACETKAGDGNYLKVEYTILDEAYANRKVWQNLNLRNKNPKAEEIGLKQLGEVMKACGMSSVSETDEFIGHNVNLTVKIKTDPNYGDKNEVNRVSSLEGSALPTPAASKPSAPAARPKQSPFGKRA